MEVYAIVRESGFSPLGIPQQRGLVYTISVIDRGGDDGRLVIDARSGRIIRFLPAYRMGDNFNEDLNLAYRPVGPLPTPTNVLLPAWCPQDWIGRAWRPFVYFSSVMPGSPQQMRTAWRRSHRRGSGQRGSHRLGPCDSARHTDRADDPG